jgi:hypothetical protein
VSPIDGQAAVVDFHKQYTIFLAFLEALEASFLNVVREEKF